MKMISVWINEDLNEDDEDRNISFVELINRYGVNHDVNILDIESEHPLYHKNLSYNLENNINIYVIPVWLIEEFDLNLYKSSIEWCIENNIKVIIDYSRETLPNDIRNCNITAHARWLIDKKIPILSCEYKFSLAPVNPRGYSKDNFIDAKTFEFDLKISHDYYDEVKSYQSKILKGSKKYLFSLLGGDIRPKLHASLLFAGLDYEGLLSNNFWSTIYGEQPDSDNFLVTAAGIVVKGEQLQLESYDKTKYAKHLIRNHDTILQAKPFDNTKNNIPGHAEEFRIPQGVYDSRFNIVCECVVSKIFYTEKTYKPIMAGIPFLIFGAPFQNQSLIGDGYEIYSEIFDYNFENPHLYSWGDSWFSLSYQIDRTIKYTNAFVEEIKRVSKEPTSIFDQKITKEKIEYNQQLFIKKTSEAEFLKYVNEIIT